MSRAIVFLNMGAPRDLKEVEVFLKNMFNDKNIITVKSDTLRAFIAKMIVFFRKDEAKENYKKLGNQSPLVKYTDEFNKKAKEISNLEVTTIMRYTPPFAKEELLKLKEKKIDSLIVIPLYPQYSTTTTKSSLEDLEDSLKKLNYSPKLEIVNNFYKEEFFLQSVVKKIKEALKENNPNNFELIFSAHSLPQKIVKNGDPYQKEIEENVKLLANKLNETGLKFKEIHLAYQSKLGPVKWLEPSLEDKLKELKGKNIIIYPLSFILDNSETEFELSIEYKEVAKSLEIKNYIVCSCINSDEEFIKGLINPFS